MLSAILDRIEEMHREISGLTVFRTPPPVIQQEWMNDGSMLYAMATGFTEPYIDSHAVRAVYSIGVDVLVKPTYQDELTPEGVSKAVETTHALIETIYAYYSAHRDLTTNANPDRIAGLDPAQAEMTIQCDGVVLPLVAHDQQGYIGTQFLLTVYTRTQYRT